jgi:uncharacterized OB-fold protein
VPHRPRPVPDELTRPFWAAAAQGELHIQRCGRCGRYQHPPAPLCAACDSPELRFIRVSGRATLHSWTETWSGARHPAFAERTPYLVALVELVEQHGLYAYTNLPGTRADQLRAGLPLTVEFEPLGEGIALPQFRLDSAAESGSGSTAGRA